MPFMTTQINSDIELLDLLREYERTGETRTMRSFLVFWNQYPIRSDQALNEWKGFKHHAYEGQKSRKKDH